MGLGLETLRSYVRTTYLTTPRGLLSLGCPRHPSGTHPFRGFSPKNLRSSGRGSSTSRDVRDRTPGVEGGQESWDREDGDGVSFFLSH